MRVIPKIQNEKSLDPLVVALVKGNIELYFQHVCTKQTLADVSAHVGRIWVKLGNGDAADDVVFEPENAIKEAVTKYVSETFPRDLGITVDFAK